MNKVELENITVRYGDHTVLDNFSLTIPEGKIIGIVGPSACGKTTVVRAICGFVNPQTGTVKVNGQTMYSREQRINIAPERRNVGVVFQDYAVWPHLSVYDNVAYPLKKRKVNKEELDREVKEALRQVNMSSYEKYLPSQLSGGQQQRVAIARALTSSKDLLIMDEPITNLDAKLREQLLVEIRLMQERLGSTIIYITHDQEAALQLCDKIVIMENDGSIGQIGTDEEIIKDPANKFIFKFIGVSNFLPVKMENGNCCLDFKTPVLFHEGKPKGYPDTDKPVEMGVRPMDIIFDDNSPVKATIIQTVFLGNIYNYFIRLGDQELRVQRITSGDEEDEKYYEGREVGVRFVAEKYYTREEVANV
ncbi:MAG: ABC transporter ATP-binding protein [Erysipelotrichaceae bacterium]|nr:ABC transporter ATP-binding protein [Erysipelotrichaceae bacterium]